jgi:hypothetical protein
MSVAISNMPTLARQDVPFVELFPVERGCAMANSDNKTTATDADVTSFIGAIEHGARKSDAERLLQIYANATGMEPKMWGASIIGYGSYHYKYESGQEGDMCRAGFSPRKGNIVLYMMGGYSNQATQQKMDALRARLGKHKTGASCLYINKLSDVDEAVLSDIVAIDLQWMDEKYPR